MARFAPVAVISAALLLCGCTAARDPTIALSTSKDQPPSLIVNGLADADLDSFDALDKERRQAVLQVHVADAPPTAPNISGDIIRRGRELVFTPRYPFQPGLKYRARFNPPTTDASPAPVVADFMIPAPRPDPVVRVAAIYPSPDTLPENLLKFYIHFSGPMSRGDAYQHVRLLDDTGRPVARPFLELGEELWNPAMTRFTLFFDPGRIKHGLVSRQELGPALTAGKTYTLVVDAAWQDEEHRPLVDSAKKTFRTAPADTRQPDPARWQIKPPPAGSTQDLVIQFDEPLDHAMLQRALSIRQAGGGQIAGKVKITDQEQRWSFTPDTPWPAGRHVLVVETILEDTAGNSIGLAFEVNLNQQSSPAGPATVEVPFNVTPRP